MSSADTYADVLVIGRGLFGCAAARHLARSGAGVVLVGPGEPADFARHDGVFASHYDEARIVRTTARDLTWARLARRSWAAFESLQGESGIEFLHRRPGLHLVEPGRTSVFLDVVRGLLPELESDVRFTQDVDTLRAWMPSLALPPGVHGYLEQGMAGYLNPRRLIEAQTWAFERAGGRVVDQVVGRIERVAGGWTVSLRNTAKLRARQVLLAVGAYSNLPGLLPEPLSLRVKCEHVLFARIGAMDADAASIFPTLVYESAIDSLSDFYLTPPQADSRGRWWLKMGCNTGQDRFFNDCDEIGAWMRAPMDRTVHEGMRSALQTLLPSLGLVESLGKKCIVTYTPKALPMIGAVDDGLYVATGGNGMGAKACDAIGELAALAVGGRLEQSPLYHPSMRPQAQVQGLAGDAAFSLRGMSRAVGG